MGLKDKQRRGYENINSFGNQGARALALPTEYKDVPWYEAKEGRNRIDILPFKVATDNYPDKKVPKGDLEYILDIWVHRFVGPGKDSFICLKHSYGKHCPICEEREKLKDEGVDEKVLKELFPSRRVLYNVVDADNPEKGLQIFEISHFLFEKELQEKAYVDDPNGVDFVTLEEGHTVVFRGSKTSLGKNEYLKFKDFSFEKRQAYPSNTIEDTVPLDLMIKIPTYEEVSAAFFMQGDLPAKKEEKSDYSKDPEGFEEQPRRRLLRRGQDSAPKQECPHGHVFGKDVVDETPECEKCELWDACAKAYDESKGK